MKLLLLAFTALVSIGVQAETLESVIPVLKYDSDYAKNLDRSFTNNYLKVVPGRMNPRVLTQDQEDKFYQAIEILEDVLNSEEFRKKVLSYKREVGKDTSGNPIYKRGYQKNYLWYDKENRLTPEDVYDVLMKGDEAMFPETDGEMNFYARVKKCSAWKRYWHTWCRGVIGSTDPAKSKTMTLNWKFYKKFEAHQMVSNIVHEWIHLLGFLHGNEKMRQEVPYVVGKIAGEVAESILKNRD